MPKITEKKSPTNSTENLVLVNRRHFGILHADVALPQHKSWSSNFWYPHWLEEVALLTNTDVTKGSHKRRAVTLLFDDGVDAKMQCACPLLCYRTIRMYWVSNYIYWEPCVCELNTIPTPINRLTIPNYLRMYCLGELPTKTLCICTAEYNSERIRI